jgi:hypothetical protein
MCTNTDFFLFIRRQIEEEVRRRGMLRKYKLYMQIYPHYTLVMSIEITLKASA